MSRRAKKTRAGAIAANVKPGAVPAAYDNQQDAAAIQAHAASAVAAEMHATAREPQAASRAVAAGTDAAGRGRAARRGKAGGQEPVGGLAAESGLQQLAPGDSTPADATAAIDADDEIIRLLRDFSIRG
jgi:hypothetical protein